MSRCGAVNRNLRTILQPFFLLFFFFRLGTAPATTLAVTTTQLLAPFRSLVRCSSGPLCSVIWAENLLSLKPVEAARRNSGDK